MLAHVPTHLLLAKSEELGRAGLCAGQDEEVGGLFPASGTQWISSMSFPPSEAFRDSRTLADQYSPLSLCVASRSAQIFI